LKNWKMVDQPVNLPVRSDGTGYKFQPV